MEVDGKTRVTRRGVMKAAIVLPLTAALPAVLPGVAHADLFGDIGVLLAQLEQQLALVSHAIATVQNLVQTVTHLSNVVKQTKQVLEKAGHGGLAGILDAAQGFLSIARGVTGSLRQIDYSAQWWQSQITRLTSDGQMTQEDYTIAKQNIRKMDLAALRNAQKMNEATNNLMKDSNEALKASSEAVQEGQSTTGVVGQLQLVSRINTQHVRVATNQAEMTAALVQANNDELVRMAEERERNHRLTEDAMKGLDDSAQATPATLPFKLDSSNWESHTP